MHTCVFMDYLDRVGQRRHETVMIVGLLQVEVNSAVLLSLAVVLPPVTIAVALTLWVAPRILDVITTLGGELRKVWKFMFATLIFDALFLILLLIAIVFLLLALGDNSPLFWHAFVLTLIMAAVLSAPGLVSMVTLPFVKHRETHDQSQNEGGEDTIRSDGN